MKRYLGNTYIPSCGVERKRAPKEIMERLERMKGDMGINAQS